MANEQIDINIAQCSKWYEISDMDIFQITEENPDPKQQTKGLILIFYYQFNQVVVIKSEEIKNIPSKFTKNAVKSANPSDLILKIT